jgi:hypothetical protein
MQKNPQAQQAAGVLLPAANLTFLNIFLSKEKKLSTDTAIRFIL